MCVLILNRNHISICAKSIAVLALILFKKHLNSRKAIMIDIKKAVITLPLFSVTKIENNYTSCLTLSISYSISPPGALTTATSPSSLPISARAMGDVTEILLFLISDSSSPTIL